jgi:putative transposase
VDYLCREHDLSIARACSSARLSRSTYYRPVLDWRERDAEVIDELNRVVKRRPRWGFWTCFDHLRFKGFEWNHKKVHRVYCNMGLNLKRRTKKRRLNRERVPLDVEGKPNASWSLDFMEDTLYSGRRFRTLNVLDEGVRECLAIEVDTSLPAERVIRVLNQLEEWRGLPEQLRLDNGPEFIANKLIEWANEKEVRLAYIQPGKPTQNAFIERFNKTYREEVLNAHLFHSLEDVREITWWWMMDYNEERPHTATQRIPPTVYRKKIEQQLIAENSTLELST